MAYAVKKGGKGEKPFIIVNQKTGQKVGQSSSLSKAHQSIAHREQAESKKIRA